MADGPAGGRQRPSRSGAAETVPRQRGEVLRLGVRMPMRAVIGLLLVSAAVSASPVPKTQELSDPLGKGYMGVFAAQNDAPAIRQVIPNTPAARSGLRDGDVFVKVGPLENPESFESIRALVSSLRPGTQINITVRRGTSLVTTTLVLTSKPPDAELPVLPEP